MNLLGFNPYVLGGIAAAFLVVASFGGCQYVRAESAIAGEVKAEHERDQARFNTKEAVKANQAQKVTIDAQDQALNRWAEIGVTPEEVRAMLAAAAAKAHELEQLVALNAKAKEKDNANPDCERLRQTDFQRVCPNRAGVLRGYERGVGAGAASQGPSAGIRPAAREPAAALSAEVPVSR
jgi:hypothetical protein